MNETATDRRRSDRILSPVRIYVIGTDISGVAFGEETTTVSVNQQGARLSLTHSLLTDDVILIRNLSNGIEEEFRVVGQFQEVFGDRREWGVEALNPQSHIWGIEFSSAPEGVQPKVLVECAACKRVMQSALSSIEYDVLLSTGLISRHCDRCGETTRWKPSLQPLTPEIEAASRQAAQAPKQTRSVRRLKLVMRIRVRNNWGDIVIAQTRDVSKVGLCFSTTQKFTAGDELHITLPFADNQTPVETKSVIVWSKVDTSGRLYGVRYVK